MIYTNVMDVYELIRTGDVKLYSNGKKLDATLKDFGKYNVYVNFRQYLMDHLFKQAKDCVVVKGDKLKELLTETHGLDNLAAFVTHLWVRSWNKEGDLSIHVDVDIEELSAFYPKKETKLNNFLVQQLNATDWFPEMSQFEKDWNFCLCSEVGGVIGYPGYEWPRTDACFRYEVAHHATNFMIGTKEQLKRYKKYAARSQFKEEVKKNLKLFT